MSIEMVALVILGSGVSGILALRAMLAIFLDSRSGLLLARYNRTCTPEQPS